MPVVCVVPSCRHVQGKPDEDGSKLSYFSFPRDEQLLQKWVAAIVRSDSKELKLSPNSKLCSKHFGAADFFHGYASGRRYLKEGSVPSVFGGKTFNFEDIADMSSGLQTAQLGQVLGLLDRGGSDAAVSNASPTAGCEDEPEQEPCVDPVHTYCRRPEEEQPSLPRCPVSVVVQCGGDDSASNSDMEVPADPPDSTAVDDDVPSDGVPEVEALQNCALELDRDIGRLSRLLEGSQQEVRDLKDRNYHLEATVKLLEERCERLEKKCREQSFSIHTFRYSPKDVQFYTGLLDYEAFQELLRLLNPGSHGENIKASVGAGSVKPGRPRQLGVHDELFLLLVWLRLGLHQHDLSVRFNVSVAAVSRVCKTWVTYIYSRLHRLRPDSPAVVEHQPTPSSLSDSGTVLTSVSPDSTTIFVCPPMDLASAETLVRQDAHDSDHKATDPLVVEGILREMGVSEQVAQLLGQLDGGATLKCGDIASLYAEVERGVPRIRNWRLFDRPLPATLLPVGRELLTVGAVLTHFQSPFLRPDKWTKTDFKDAKHPVIVSLQ